MLSLNPVAALLFVFCPTAILAVRQNSSAADVFFSLSDKSGPAAAAAVGTGEVEGVSSELVDTTSALNFLLTRRTTFADRRDKDGFNSALLDSASDGKNKIR